MASVKWSGLDELIADLRHLPADLALEASGIVVSAGNDAAQAIRDAYPERTGDLKNHVIVVPIDLGSFGAGVAVKNTSKLAYIFENGTQARHTSIGANRGSMPPGHVFVPRIIRYRRAMYDALKDLLVRHGLRVSGDADVAA
jgi:hypothetical protein